ncbi:MAG: universal stress protein [Chloroflexaceae bacterium]|nr:universal stress protein [Chloroflexaceae bacterium]
MFKRILLATDGSPVVERCVLYTAHLARTNQAEVVVLHVYELPERYASYPGYQELVEQLRAVSCALVDEVAQQLRKDGAEARGELRIGDPSEAIILAAADYDIDLIVMGTRGSSNLSDILGSVSAHVLRHSRCPVLQIP